MIDSNLKPREKLLKYGSTSLTNDELLAIIINTGTKDKTVFELSKIINNEIEQINNYNDITINSLKEIPGIGIVKATKILASIEYGRRTTKIIKEIKVITSPKDVYEYLKLDFQYKTQEEFGCIYLDTKNQIISFKILFKGTLNKSIVHPREIFKEALKATAKKIILVHNHPSGDINPSKEDIITTRNLIKIGDLLMIPVIDHIIIGNNNYYSFKESEKM